MTKMIQIRNVPENVHRILKSRAALTGVSLSDYLLSEIERIISLPTEEELLKQLSQADPIEMASSSADLIRKDRDMA